jgi:hypothetical protein
MNISSDGRKRDHGISCVIAPSCGDIFAGNAVQNGLLTAAVTDDEAVGMIAALTETPACRSWSISSDNHRLWQPDLPLRHRSDAPHASS